MEAGAAVIYVWCHEVRPGVFVVVDTTDKVYLQTPDARVAVQALTRLAKRKGYAQGRVAVDPKTLAKQANLPR